MGRDLTRGDMPALVLAALATNPAHGYAIARSIEEKSGRAFHMKEGTLYPVLRTLEADGLISGEWEVQQSGPARKVYRITERGLSELASRRRDWDDYAAIMQALLGGKSDAQPA